MDNKTALRGLTNCQSIFRRFLEGDTIQLFSPSRQEWMDLDNPAWWDNMQYRVKPELEFKFKLDKTREVIYFGKKLSCRTDHKWIATDNGGSIYSYKRKPTSVGMSWISTSSHQQIGSLTNAENTNLSLVKI